MLGRHGYSTRELEPALAPDLTGTSLSGEKFDIGALELVIGGFDLKAQAELGVWRRLFSELAPQQPCRTFFVLDRPTEKQFQAVRSMIQPSLWSSTFVSPSIEGWMDLVQPDKPGRSFACFISNGLAEPFMVGLPTEEALDRFIAGLAPA